MSEEDNKQTHCCQSPEYFTVQELAKYSRIGQKLLYQAVRNREIRHVKVGQKAIISKKDFEIWFERNSKAPVPEVSSAQLKRKRKPVFSLDD